MKILNWGSNQHSGERDKSGVVIPDKAELLLALAEKIIAAHNARGTNSPLKGALAVQLMVKKDSAREKHDEAMKYLKIATAALDERDAILGINRTHQDSSPSLKFYVQCAADILTISPEATSLAEWGLTSKAGKVSE
jgi:hypothetical protein